MRIRLISIRLIVPIFKIKSAENKMAAFVYLLFFKYTTSPEAQCTVRCCGSKKQKFFVGNYIHINAY